MNKLNEEYIKSVVVNAEYIRIGKKTTICCLILKNGFEVIGISNCIDANNFDEVIGMDLAYKDAFNKIWELEGYLLQEQLNK